MEERTKRPADWGNRDEESAKRWKRDPRLSVWSECATKAAGGCASEAQRACAAMEATMADARRRHATALRNTHTLLAKADGRIAALQSQLNQAAAVIQTLQSQLSDQTKRSTLFESAARALNAELLCLRGTQRACEQELSLMVH